MDHPRRPARTCLFQRIGIILLYGIMVFFSFQGLNDLYLLSKIPEVSFNLQHHHRRSWLVQQMDVLYWCSVFSFNPPGKQPLRRNFTLNLKPPLKKAIQLPKQMVPSCIFQGSTDGSIEHNFVTSKFTTWDLVKRDGTIANINVTWFLRVDEMFRLDGGNSNIFGIFTPISGEMIPIWFVHIFQMGLKPTTS